MYKVLILTAKLGGGHINTAKILANKYLELGYEVKIFDFTQSLSRVGSKSLPEWFYYYTAVRFSFLWSWFVFIIQRIPKTIFLKISKILLGDLLRKEVVGFSPDLIVSTYGHLCAILEKFPETVNIEMQTIVSDPFTAVFYWFLGDRDRVQVMSQKVYNYAQTRIIPNERLELVAPIVNPLFKTRMKALDLEKFRLKIDLRNQPVVLVLAGGEGLAGGYELVKKCLESLESMNIVVICGRDHFLQTRLLELIKSHNLENLRVFGFSDEIYEFMNLADVIVTKAGPATILEAQALGKPLLLVSALWQEKGNLEYVLENRLGFYEPDINKIPTKILEIIDM
jgi:UDP-N-acetylglucosamine:LPS N-acetylglucosamine transferase